jgi:hypothetical protein
MLALKSVTVMATVAMALAYSTGQQVTSKFENIHLDDVIFNNNLLFEQNARSKVICAQLCANHFGGDCVTFTYLSRSRMCRGHAVVITQISAKTSAPGARSYKQFGAGMY